MTDYPEDVMKAAREVAFNVCAQVAGSHEIIARAILAERERCASKARLAMVDNPDADELTCSICAAAIRGGSNA